MTPPLFCRTMKTRIVMKEFSALSFDAGIVTGGTVPATLDTPLRLTPESDASCSSVRPFDLRSIRTRSQTSWLSGSVSLGSHAVVGNFFFLAILRISKIME